LKPNHPSYRTTSPLYRRDSAERETFKVNFVNHYQGSAAIKDESESQKKWNKIASKAQDIQRIYNRYVDPATGDMEPDGLNRLVDRIYTDSKVKNDEKLRLWVQMDTDLQGGISYTEFTAFLGLNSVSNPNPYPVALTW